MRKEYILCFISGIALGMLIPGIYILFKIKYLPVQAHCKGPEDYIVLFRNCSCSYEIFAKDEIPTWDCENLCRNQPPAINYSIPETNTTRRAK